MSKFRKLYYIYEKTLQGDETVNENSLYFTTSKDSAFENLERVIDQYNNTGGTFFCERMSNDTAIAYQVNGENYITMDTFRTIITIKETKFEDY